MPTRLDDSLVTDALKGLTGWTGDSSRLRRTAAIPGGAVDAFLTDVAISADSMDHHPMVERGGGDVRFELWTHSADGVTELDIALASRIDDLIAKYTPEPANEVVAGAPTEAGMGAGGKVSHGLRPDGDSPRRDVDVVSEAGREGRTTEGAPDADRGEPFIGASSASGTPTVPMPDDVPNEPEPGIATAQGQGTPPAGQNADERDDRGGAGNPG